MAWVCVCTAALDIVWDLQRVLDYLQQRPDVDAARIAVTGISLGGMHSWLLAAADDRIAAAAPMIGVQHFGWAVQQLRYHARVESIPLVFQAAAADMQQAQQQQQRPTEVGSNGSSGSGSHEISSEVVTAVWNRLLPGLLEHYDAPQSLPLIAPRPLLVANGELDPRCPMQGVELAMAAARAAYEQQGAGDKLQLYVVPGCTHECTACMWEQVHAFFDRHLLNAA
jgi:dienelactone hydrolase